MKRLLIALFFAGMAYGQTIQHGIKLTIGEASDCILNPTLASYNVYRSLTSNGEVWGKPTYTGVPCAPTYLDVLANLTPGTLYFYKVTTVDLIGGEGLTFSQEATATFPVPPTPPVSLSATSQ